MKVKKPEIIIGLDIGTTKICALICEKNENGKLHVLGLGKADPADALHRGEIINIEKATKAIKIAVDKASESIDDNLEIDSVFIGIAGQHIKSIHRTCQRTRNNGLNETISEDDIGQLIEDMNKIPVDPGEQILHIFPEEYSVDDMVGINDPKGMTGVRIEGKFHMITGKNTAAKNLETCVRGAGINEITGVVLEPVASAEAILSKAEKEGGIALVDIGGGTTDLAIFYEGIIRHTAVIPLGGNIITRDIKIGCHVLEKEAEAMKVRFGSALADEVKENEIIVINGERGREPKEISIKNLSHIIQARVEEIFEYVELEISKSGYKNLLPFGMVVTGGGAQLKNISKLASYVTGLDARIGCPDEYLDKGMVSETKTPMYSTGIGLVLYGLNRMTNQQPKKKKQKFGKKAKEKMDNPWGKGLFDGIKKYFEDGQIKDFDELG